MINSLYQLIKQKSQEKGRPLKIVCDWDECLFAREAFGHFIYFNELTGKQPSFTEFFKKFWENSEFAPLKGEEHLTFCVKSGIKEIDERMGNITNFADAR